MCRQDAPEKGITPTALRWQAEPQILKLCHWIKAMRLGYRDDEDMQKMPERLKFPDCTVLSVCGWTEGSLIEHFP